MSSEYVRLACGNAYVLKTTLIFRASAIVRGKTLVLASPVNYVVRFRPAMLKGNDTSDAMYGAEAEEVERIHSAAEKIFANSFVKTADMSAIRKWEGILGISFDSTDLETRREQVLSEMSFRPPYTRWNFDTVLESVLGEGNFIYDIDIDNFVVIINLQKSPDTLKPNFSTYIRAVLPANIRLVLSIMYTHLYLKANHTFGEMKKFTFGELSKYKEYNY